MEEIKMSRGFHIPTGLLPKPKKIMKRGLYEMMWKCGREGYKPRDYEKRVKKGKY